MHRVYKVIDNNKLRRERQNARENMISDMISEQTVLPDLTWLLGYATHASRIVKWIDQ